MQRLKVQALCPSLYLATLPHGPHTEGSSSTWTFCTLLMVLKILSVYGAVENCSLCVVPIAIQDSTLSNFLAVLQPRQRVVHCILWWSASHGDLLKAALVLESCI